MDGDKVELIDKIYDELGCLEPQTKAIIAHVLKDIKLFDIKHHDYGASNISKFGEQGVLVRVSDKVERLINLSKADVDPANEGVNDSWQDLSIYGVIVRVVRAGQWL